MAGYPRDRSGAIAQMESWAESKIRTLPNSGTPAKSVQGHCVGAVGRAFLGRAAGFDNATQWADRAAAAGILLDGKPEKGDIIVWRGGKEGNGHVGIATSAIRFLGVDRPTTNQVGESSISGVWSSLRYAGRIRPETMYRLGWPVIPAVADPPAPYPGKPIGWPSPRTCSSGAPIVTLEKCFGLPITGKFSNALSRKITGWQLTHPGPMLKDRVGPGAAGPSLYAGIVAKKYPGA